MFLQPDEGSNELPIRNCQVLVSLGNKLETAICGEPAISSLKNRLGPDYELFVCGIGSDLYHNHPAVSGILEAGSEVDANNFGHTFMLCDTVGQEQQDMHLVDWHAAWLNVRLQNRIPRIYFDDQDKMRFVEMGIVSLPHPRIAISTHAESELDQWPQEKWKQLCEILQQTVNAEIIHVDNNQECYLGVGLNCTENSSCRDKAIVLSGCDIVISANNEYAHLAAFVDVPRVVLFGSVDPETRMHNGTAKALKAEGYEGVCQIPVHEVIDAIVDICGIKEGK